MAPCLTTLSLPHPALAPPRCLQQFMDRLSLVALACLPETRADDLGSLSWSLGKLGSRLGAERIHPPVRRPPGPFDPCTCA